MGLRKHTDDEAEVVDRTICAICGGDRRLVVERSPEGMPARCVMYHPGYDKVGLRRWTPKGECMIVDSDGIRRRDPENDVRR
jgi:hypothetical protein